MQNIRSFKLRNGTIVKEWYDPVVNQRQIKTLGCNGYINTYRIVNNKKEKYLCLLLPVEKGDYPAGGSHGIGYDIVKEIR